MRLTSSPMIATSCASIRGPGRVGVVRISQLSRHPRPYMPHNFIVPFRQVTRWAAKPLFLHRQRLLLAVA